MSRSILIIFLEITLANGLLVTVDQGTVNGTYMKARDGKLFNAFFGIPFAQPPVGELRLKAPVPAGPWNGILNATQAPIGCMERDNTNKQIQGSEDCLSLNVFTPLNARKGDKLAVLFYIYGGLFKFNTNMDHGPQYMMTKKLIIVMPNYRSGPLGFLSTGDTVIPGNFALKDQLLALKWTRQNIHHFGGDPNHITINGHSSGAVCTHLHTLSPASKGLFQQVIIQSGAAYCSLGYWGPDVARAIAKEFAVKAGCPSVESSQDMYKCFMNLNVELFVTVPEMMYVWYDSPDAPFRPTIESILVEDAFITDIPQHLPYHSPHLPWLIGLTTAEGAVAASEYFQDDGEKLRTLNEFYRTLFPITFQYLWNTKRQHLNYISQILKTHYFGKKDMGLQTIEEMVQLFTHGGFGFCGVEAIRSYPGPKYVYWYEYVSNYTTAYEIANYNKSLGASHSDEVNLLFRTEKTIDILTDQDIMVSEEMVKRWVNFIRTSNPNFPYKINTTMMDYWKPVSSQRIEYLMINLNGSMGTDLYKDVYPFWKSLPIGSKYYTYNSMSGMIAKPVEVMVSNLLK